MAPKTKLKPCQFCDYWRVEADHLKERAIQAEAELAAARPLLEAAIRYARGGETSEELGKLAVGYAYRQAKEKP